MADNGYGTKNESGAGPSMSASGPGNSDDRRMRSSAATTRRVMPWLVSPVDHHETTPRHLVRDPRAHGANLPRDREWNHRESPHVFPGGMSRDEKKGRNR